MVNVMVAGQHVQESPLPLVPFKERYAKMCSDLTDLNAGQNKTFFLIMPFKYCVDAHKDCFSLRDLPKPIVENKQLKRYFVVSIPKYDPSKMLLCLHIYASFLSHSDARNEANEYFERHSL